MFTESAETAPILDLYVGQSIAEISNADLPRVPHTMSTWSTQSNAGRALSEPPIQILEDGIEVVPRNMVLGRPYTFELDGRHFVAVRRGVDDVDLFVVPN